MADPDLSQFIAAPKVPPPGAPDLSQFMSGPAPARSAPVPLRDKDSYRLLDQPQAIKQTIDQPEEAPDLTPFAAKPATPPANGPDLSLFMGKVTKSFTDVPHEIVRQTGAAMKQFAADAQTPDKPTDFNVLGVTPRTARMAADVAGVAAAPLAGAATSLVGRPVETATGGKVPRKLTGEIVNDAASLAVPLVGEAKLAGEAARFGKEAGIGETLARDALKKQKAFTPSKTTAKGAAAPDLTPFMGKEVKPEVGPVVGDEADPATRIDNALFRAGGHTTADKLEAMKFLKATPDEILDPKLQESLYHEIEQKMVDPAHEVPAELKPAFDHFAPYYKEQTEIINRLRQRGDPSLEPYLEDQGYVARRAVGHTPMMDESGPQRSDRDPIQGKKSLTKTTTAQKARTAGLVLVDDAGKRTFVKPAEADPEWKPGMTIRGSFDKPMRVEQATTREIEANTDTRYHKNALVNTVDNVVRLRQVERNLQVLDETTKAMKDEGLAHQDEWRHKNDRGEMVVNTANTKRPDGFVEVPHIPQLKGWSFDPKVAAVLKDYYPGPKEPLENVLSKVNRFLIGSMFWNPVVHAGNVGAHWTIGRGFDWAAPKGWSRLFDTGAKAIKEVATQGPEYQRMIREGSGLMRGDIEARNFYQVMAEKSGREMTEDPRTFAALSKAFKLGTMTPADLYKTIMGASSKALWTANDIFLMQRQLELQAKGLSARTAIKEAEKDIPNYRIPSQVMKSRWLAQWLKNPNLTNFGRYHYGVFKAWGSMFEDLVGKDATPEERKDALGKFLVAAGLAFGAYPLMDEIAKKTSGNDKARFKRAGPLTIPDNLVQMSQGQKDWASALASVISPAPATESIVEVPMNRDAFTGKHIVEPASSLPSKVVQAGEYAADKFNPAQEAMRAAKPQGAGREAARTFGLDLPTDDQQAGAAKGKRYDRSQAKSRTKRDLLLRWAEEHGLPR